MAAGFRAELKRRSGGTEASNGCLIIGEVAQSHDGSLGLAHAFVDAIADAGADAVKFQTHIAAAESTPSEPWRVKFSRQDASRYDYWKRMEFTEEQWLGLRVHAEERGLFFLSSPFSIAAVELLERVGVAAWKIASGEISDSVMLDRILETRLPIMLSTGMSLISEIDDAVGRIRAARVPLAILQCTTEYPCPPERVGVNMISSYRDRYGCAAGLSDHSGTIYPGLAAVTLGAEVVEVHVTLSREMFGPDVPSSITTLELRQLADGIRFIERMNAHDLNKDGVSRELAPLRKLFTKSIVARVRIPAGTILTEEALALKKPGTGLPVARLSSLIGKRTLRTLEQDELLADDDVESKGVK
jgi:N-acetylneuraminate synthase